MEEGRDQTRSLPDLDMQVNPVKQRARYFGLIIRSATRCPATGKRRVAQISAAAGVHRGNQLHIGRKRHMAVGTRNTDFAGFKRLS
jgi:hypothetical protein